MQKDKYFRPYRDGKYIHLGPNDISKRDIPRKDRCEGFDDLWLHTYQDVMKYWDGEPVKDIHEFDIYEHITVEDA